MHFTCIITDNLQSTDTGEPLIWSQARTTGSMSHTACDILGHTVCGILWPMVCMYFTLYRWCLRQNILVVYTLVCLKRGLGCVAIYGESPDFLEKYFFAKTQKSSFFGKVLFFEKAKVLIFGKMLFREGEKVQTVRKTLVMLIWNPFQKGSDKKWIKKWTSKWFALLTVMNWHPVDIVRQISKGLHIKFLTDFSKVQVKWYLHTENQRPPT